MSYALEQIQAILEEHASELGFGEVVHRHPASYLDLVDVVVGPVDLISSPEELQHFAVGLLGGLPRLVYKQEARREKRIHPTYGHILIFDLPKFGVGDATVSFFPNGEIAQTAAKVFKRPMIERGWEYDLTRRGILTDLEWHLITEGKNPFKE